MPVLSFNSHAVRKKLKVAAALYKFSSVILLVTGIILSIRTIPLIKESKMHYAIKKTVTDLPWRYGVYVNHGLVSLTFTKWGAERLIKRMKANKGKKWTYND